MLAHNYSIHMDVNFQVTEGTASEILRSPGIFPNGGALDLSLEDGLGYSVNNELVKPEHMGVGKRVVAIESCTCKRPGAYKSCYLLKQHLYNGCVDSVLAWMWSHEHFSNDFFTKLAGSLIFLCYASQCGEMGMMCY